MEFERIKPDELYYAVTEGQFMGLFYCVKKNKFSAHFFANFYGGSMTYKIFEKFDFDWPFVIGEEDDLPDDSWAADMEHVKYSRNEFSDYHREFIPYLFEKGVYEI